MNIPEMNKAAQEAALEMKRRFPEMTDREIGKVARYIVLCAYATKESEQYLADKFGPETGLSEQGYELIFTECAKIA